MKNTVRSSNSFFSFVGKNYLAWLPGLLASLIFFLFCLIENNPFTLSAMVNLHVDYAKYLESVLQEYQWVIWIAYLKILVLYLIIGLLFNLFVYFSLVSIQKLTQHYFSKIKLFLMMFFFIFVFFFLQLAKKIVNHPQVFDQHFYLKNSVYFDITRFLTTYFTPSLLSGIQYLFFLAGFVLIAILAGEWLWKKRGNFKKNSIQIICFAQKQKKWFLIFAGIFVIGIVVLCIFSFQKTTEEKQFPNLVMISSAGFNGNDLMNNSSAQEKAPFVYTLMQKGSVFTGIFTPNTEDLPAWTAILTSNYPYLQGIQQNYSASKNKQQKIKTLASFLKEKGYNASVFGDEAAEVFKQMDFGFSEVETPENTIPLILKRLILKSNPFLLSFFLNPLGEKIFSTIHGINQYLDPEHLISSVKNEIDRNEKKKAPFFILTGVSYNHSPYAMPYPFYRKYGDPKYQGKYIYQYDEMADKEMTSEDAKQIRALYDGSLEAFDGFVKSVADYLKEKKLFENTVIVILSPKSEILAGKAVNNLENLDAQEVYKIPFILFGPGVEQGKINSKAASSIDIVPTVLESLGFKEKPAYFKGKSLSGLWERNVDVYLESGLWNTNSSGVRRILYPELHEMLKTDSYQPKRVMIQPFYENLIQTAKQRIIISKGFKLIYLPLKDQVLFKLYDLTKDPSQKEDLSSKNPVKLAEMKKILFAEITQNSGFIIKDDYLIPVINEPLF